MDGLSREMQHSHTPHCCSAATLMIRTASYPPASSRCPLVVETTVIQMLNEEEEADCSAGLMRAL